MKASPSGGIAFRAVRWDSDDECALLASWNNDPATRRFLVRAKDAANASREITPDDIRREGDGLGESVMLMVGEAPVGVGRFALGPPKLLRPSPQTAWLAPLIGERDLRGRGLGRRLVEHLEALATQAGARDFEVGVFEFNERALRLFQSLGYREVARLPERTWWDGRRWEEIRLRKTAGRTRPP